MRALLNSLGLTLWSSIAIVLAVGLALVGYRVSLIIRNSPALTSSAPTAAGRVQAPAMSYGSAAPASKSVAPPTQGEMISYVIGREMTAAQAALQAGQWQEALDDLQATEQHRGITVFDAFKIHDFRAFAEFKLRKYKEAQADYEAALAARKYTPEETARTTRLLFRVAAQNQQYAKAIEYGKQVSDSPSVTPDDLNIMAQLYYLQRDCKNTVAWADKALAASKKAGEAPKENTYQFKLQCASDAGDTAGMESPLVDLIKLTHKTTYWNSLLRLERQDERDDHNLLMIYRVMYDTNSMNADTDYIEMAQLLGDAALPGEAAAALNKAMSSGIVKDEHKERTTRLLDALQARADSDRRGLPRQEVESNESSVGDLGVKLGEVYYGFEDYQQSVEAITQGLRKGLVTQQDDAYVYLGLAQLKLKNLAAAERAFTGLKNVPNVSPRIVKLWGLYADTLAGQAQIAEQASLRQPQAGDRN
jgi:tetratricopeptide (TPR) repeat protein